MDPKITIHAGTEKQTVNQHPARLRNIGDEFDLLQTRGRKRLTSRLPGISNKMKGGKLRVKGAN